MRTTRNYVALAAAVLLLAACANQKEPAEKAVAQIQSSFAELRADAEQYAADEIKDIDDSIDNLKKNLANQDYRAVMIAAPSVASAVKNLKASVARKKAEAEEMLATAQSEWNAISASVPQLVTDLQSRVDAFSRSRRLPKDFSPEQFTTAKATLDDIKKVWGEATAEFAQGKAADAVRKGRVVKQNAEYLLRRISA